ncbi:hypothetical protein [Streptomyces sp. ISL-100]|uniref:hypothetical protein n=1 Tax=Streptomyces sp. ISL-100 TaxID=2819173 RepID=UPI001BE8A0A8|nr:hypothetical protein [Streptomyces sp. ISL-100]MBT2401746.1 hypothetical protein [Streptomyces sp. ISL-100]
MGAAGPALEITVQYAKDRVQLGRPIGVGTFRPVKHRLADPYVPVESASSIAWPRLTPTRNLLSRPPKSPCSKRTPQPQSR